VHIVVYGQQQKQKAKSDWGILGFNKGFGFREIVGGTDGTVDALRIWQVYQIVYQVIKW